MPKDKSTPVKVIFKCGHSIMSRVSPYSLADPLGFLYKTARRKLHIRHDKLCGMCEEDKRWKS